MKFQCIHLQDHFIMSVIWHSTTTQRPGHSLIAPKIYLSLSYVSKLYLFKRKLNLIVFERYKLIGDVQFSRIEIQFKVSTRWPNKLYFILYFVFGWPILKQYGMSTCRQNKHAVRHLVEAENAISNCENWLFQYKPSSLHDTKSKLQIRNWCVK